MRTIFILLTTAVAFGQTRGPMNVINFGAVGDGAADDTVAVQSALDAAAAAHGSAFFPCGVYAVSKTLEVASFVRLEDCATVRAVAPMNAVINVGSAGYIYDGWFRGGIIDANNFANDGLFLRQYAHFNVVDTEVINALVNGFHLGDPSAGGGYEAILSRVRTARTTGMAAPGSTGLLVDENATDSNVTTSEFTGSDAGVRTMTGGNFFTDIRVSSPPGAGWMTVGFDDYGSGNFWKGCEANTAQLAGLHTHRFDTIVQGCRFYNNAAYAQDNVAVGIVFDQAAPYATVMTSGFIAQDSSHRLAQDIQVAKPSSVQMFGNQTVNVTQHY